MTNPPTIARREFLAAGLLAAAADPAAAAPSRGYPIVELRQYTCRAGRRDALATLLEREFIESQEALGAHVMGIFRDRDDPDRFVWLRGFDSMPARAQALGAFYGGPVWRAHRQAANATMLDSDNVLLLHPATAGGGFELAPQRPRSPDGLLAFIHYLDDATLPGFADFFEAEMVRQAAADGGEVLATFASETSRNTFPALPVRERDRVFIWLARPGSGGEARFLDRRHQRSGWRDGAAEPLLPAFMRKPELLRLAPSARSPLG